MTESKPLVSIISVNFNATKETLDFLNSLDQLSYPNYEVIIVDNASDVNPQDQISKQFPYVKLISSDKNLGFAGGNNLGIDKAKGEYLLFVNNDTVLSEDLIPSLLSVFKDYPNVAGVSPKIIYDGTNTIQFAGYTDLSLTARNEAIGHKIQDGKLFSDVISTPFLHGAAMMISAGVVKKVGKMPEDYFLYYEELDWCFQMRQKGFQLMVDRRVSIEHKASVSVGKNSPLKTYYLMRNRWLFIRRNGHFLQKVYYSFYVTFIVLPKDILKHLVKNEKQQLKALLKGYLWNLRN